MITLAEVDVPLQASLDELQPLERAAIDPRATQKRIVEYVAGRRAARAALAMMFGADAAACSIVRTEGGENRGAPVVVGAPAPVHVTISHAAGRACAAASFEIIGVDLVALDDDVIAASAEAFTEAELARCREQLAALGLADRAPWLLFAAKEASLKIERIGFGASLLELTINFASGASPPPLGMRAPIAIDVDYALRERTERARGHVTIDPDRVLLLLRRDAGRG